MMHFLCFIFLCWKRNWGKKKMNGIGKAEIRSQAECELCKHHRYIYIRFIKMVLAVPDDDG